MPMNNTILTVTLTRNVISSTCWKPLHRIYILNQRIVAIIFVLMANIAGVYVQDVNVSVAPAYIASGTTQVELLCNLEQAAFQQLQWTINRGTNVAFYSSDGNSFLTGYTGTATFNPTDFTQTLVLDVDFCKTGSFTCTVQYPSNDIGEDTVDVLGRVIRDDIHLNVAGQEVACDEAVEAEADSSVNCMVTYEDVLSPTLTVSVDGNVIQTKTTHNDENLNECSRTIQGDTTGPSQPGESSNITCSVTVSGVETSCTITVTVPVPPETTTTDSPGAVTTSDTHSTQSSTNSPVVTGDGEVKKKKGCHQWSCVGYILIPIATILIIAIVLLVLKVCRKLPCQQNSAPEARGRVNNSFTEERNNGTAPT